MNKFSNINWGVVALGCLGDRPWVIVFVSIILISAGWITGNVALVVVLVVSAQILLAPRTVYLALQGNRILLKEIKNLNLSPEAEQSARLKEFARGRKSSLILVILGRLLLNYGILGFIPFRHAYRTAGLPFDYVQVFQVFFVIFIIDVIVLLLILSIAFVRDEKENVLYPGEENFI